MRDMYIPLGFRFNPSEEEVIRGFLYPKVTGLPLPWDGVKDRCVYGAEPWNVFFDADSDDMESSHCWQTKKESGSVKKTIYVFTSITKSSPNAKDSKRAARIAGCGTWSGQTGPKDITHSDTGEIIGYSRMLTFKIKKDSANKFNDQDSLLGHWIMHEYTLSDSTLRMAGLTHNDIVLCKITRIIKNKQIESTSQHHHPFQINQIHPTAAPAEEVPYYSPENNSTAGESYCSTTTFDDPQIQIHQTVAAEEALQYYSPEINTAAEGDGDGDDHDHVNNNNNKRSRGGQQRVEEEILEMQQQQEPKKQKSSTDDQIFENIYDFDFDFGDIIEIIDLQSD